MKVGASGELFRTESHPPAQCPLRAFSRDSGRLTHRTMIQDCVSTVIPRRVVPDELVDYVATQLSSVGELVRISRETTSGSTVPQRKSTSVHSFLVDKRSVVCFSFPYETETKDTDTIQGTFAPIHGPVKRGEIQPQPFIREVNHRVEH